MSTLSLFKETVVPAQLEANALYFIAPAGQAGVLELYMTDNAGGATRAIIDAAVVQGMIDSSLATASSAVFADDIAARDALTLKDKLTVIVLDATADPDVSSGGATYIYRASNTSWIKQSEAESMDVSITWAALLNKPTSSVAQIDAAVAAVHSHTNKTELDKVGEADGEMTYGGSHVAARLDSASW